MIALVVNAAYRRHTPIVQKTVVGGIAPLLAFVPGRLNLQCSFAPITVGSGVLQRHF